MFAFAAAAVRVVKVASGLPASSAGTGGTAADHVKLLNCRGHFRNTGMPKQWLRGAVCTEGENK